MSRRRKARASGEVVPRRPLPLSQTSRSPAVAADVSPLVQRRVPIVDGHARYEPPGRDWYPMVGFYSWRTAQELRRQHEKAGYAVWVQPTGDGVWYEVLIGRREGA